MKREHKDLHEESHRGPQGGAPTENPPRERGNYSDGRQEAAQPGTPFRGRPAHQGKGSRRSTPREREDPL